jgi:hypothetical protein
MLNRMHRVLLVTCANDRLMLNRMTATVGSLKTGYCIAPFGCGAI